jgi:hypothetical protein
MVNFIGHSAPARMHGVLRVDETLSRTLPPWAQAPWVARGAPGVRAPLGLRRQLRYTSHPRATVAVRAAHNDEEEGDEESEPSASSVVVSTYCRHTLCYATFP